MSTARSIVAIVMAAGGLMSAASAQQASEGIVTGINRLSGMIAIRQTQNGTVGASPAPAQQFKVTDGALLESVHAGDLVTFSVTDTGGTKTVTKIERQKP